MDTYQLVLVGRDSGEDRLREDVGAELFALQIDDGTGRVAFHPPDNVNSRLVAVHRIQDDLHIKTRNEKLLETGSFADEFVTSKGKGVGRVDGGYMECCCGSKVKVIASRIRKRKCQGPPVSSGSRGGSGWRGPIYIHPHAFAV